MQKKGRKITILIICILVAITGIIFFYKYHPDKAIGLVFPNLDEITSVNTVIKNDSAFITVAAVLQNKNPYKLTIDTLAFELILSDTSVARQTIPLNIEQSRFETDTVDLPLHLLMPKVMGLIRGLQDQDSTTIQVKGFIVYQTIFGRKKIDFDQKKRIEVPVPPQIKVLKVERQGFNLRDKILKATATVEIINKGKRIDLKLTKIHYDMTVKNTLHTSGVLEKPIIVKPQSSTILKVPMEIEVYHPLKTIWKIKTDDDRLNYSLHLTFMVKENLTEKAYTSPVEITATGILELVK
ncbi:MAG: LEA type 2 family protein [Bacteroidota bacterium]